MSEAGAKAARRRRAAPKRTGPDRSGWTADPADDQPGEETPDPDAPGEQGPEPDVARDVERLIADAVRLGYAVVGDNLHLGRRFARRIGQGDYRLDEFSGDVGDLARRFAEVGADMAQLWVDLVGAVVRDPQLHEALKPRPGTPDAGQRPGNGTVALAVHVKGHRHARGESSGLRLPVDAAGLACAGLHAVNPELPPIERIGFVAGSGAKAAVAVVHVPAEQPAGRYNGIIFDPETHASLGTLTVDVPA